MKERADAEQWKATTKERKVELEERKVAADDHKAVEEKAEKICSWTQVVLTRSKKHMLSCVA